MNSQQQQLEGIRHLLSLLYGEVTVLEQGTNQVLQALRKLEISTDRDDLTGLLRRKSFFQKWDALLAECRRMEESCGVILIDVDHFKKVNDTHGHAVGDDVLRRVGALLRDFESSHAGYGALAARLGGEEFALVCRGDSDSLSQRAEELRVLLEEQDLCVGPTQESLHFTASLGVAVQGLQSGPRIKETALEQADEALYAAKTGGRNQVRVWRKASGSR